MFGTRIMGRCKGISQQITIQNIQMSSTSVAINTAAVSGTDFNNFLLRLIKNNFDFERLKFILPAFWTFFLVSLP